MILGYLGCECRNTGILEPPDAQFRFHQQKSDQPSWYSLKLQPLVSLCLVSKRLCNAIQPILYHEFMLGYGDSWNSELYTWDGRLLSFLRTVAQRRDLAGFVKRIHIAPHLLQASYEALENKRKEREARGPTPDDNGLLMPPEIELDRAFLEARNGRLTLTLRRSILEDEAVDTLREVGAALNIKRPGRLSAKHLIILLLAALPNLEYCSLFFGPDSHKMALHSKTLSAAGISQLPVRTINLSVLRHAERRFDLSSNARDLLKFSPCLETLNLHKCYWTRERAAFPSLPRLKHIRITSSRLNEKGLEKILDSSNSLRSFTYEAGLHFGDYGEDRRWDCSDHFELRNAARYLTRYSKTLESLHIDLRYRGGEPATPSTFSFRELTALKHLFLNLDEFHSRFFDHRWTDESQLLVQILPASLTSLHLAGRIDKDLPRLEQGLLGLGEAALKGQFQDLMEVRWDRKAKLNAEVAVRSLFADAGLDFAYDSWPGTRLSFGEGYTIPPASFYNPSYALPSSEDEDL
ncbi:uncharacterized protein APUU_60166S [Aspergillus puulaauensis]|uniref:F-box domain-containing protein n=1 Tax=Aspergillus puulaauensis TaxID=1220207 RepID=A0A7R7XUH1_9EURO|nr:uncharacterized protein APUU_60166S [Aspergillus puulaauensis]BCS27118.1 hypothetical protein APUU_60166S [Aspergillus puulaauensis]